MSEAIKRTIKVVSEATLSFEYRENKDVLKDNAKNVLVKADLRKLSADDLMEWAFSAMVVSFQSKLRSKNPPKAVMFKATLDAAGKEQKDANGVVIGEWVPYDPTSGLEAMYLWSVPSRGTRSTQDPAKVEEAAAKLVSKMDDAAKKHMVYTMLISMGKSEAEATVISGYTPVK